MSIKQHLPRVARGPLAACLFAAALIFAFISSVKAARLAAPAAPVEVPPVRGNHSLTLLDSDIYMFGGSSVTATAGSMNDLWRFDTTDSTWHSATVTESVPPPRRDHAAAVLNGKLYIFGGESAAGQKLEDIWAYNPSRGGWSQVTQETTPPGRSGHAALPYNSSFLVYGGQFQNGSSSADMWAFDPATGYWSIHSWLPDLNYPKSGPTMGQVGNKIYIAGGELNSSQKLLGAYNLSSSQFELITPIESSPRPPLRRNHAGVVANGEIYIFGGTSVTSTATLSDAWRFNPGTNEWTQLPDVPAALTGVRAEAFPASGMQAAAPGTSDPPMILLFGGFTAQGLPNPVSYIFYGTGYHPSIILQQVYLPLALK